MSAQYYDHYSIGHPKKKDGRLGKKPNYHYWTEQDELFLRENYGKIHIVHLAKKLNRTKRAVKQHYERMKGKT